MAPGCSPTLQDALERVGRCGTCPNFTELETCELCADPGHDQGLLCIVEAPGDVMAWSRRRFPRRLFCTDGAPLAH